MNTISKILIGIALIITIASNFATYYGILTAVKGVQNSEENGIASLAWGMDFAYSWSFISLIGCCLLTAGIVSAVLSRKCNCLSSLALSIIFYFSARHDKKNKNGKINERKTNFLRKLQYLQKAA